MPLNPKVSLGTDRVKSHTKEHAGMFARERQSSHSLLNDWVGSRAGFPGPNRTTDNQKGHEQNKTKNNIILYALQ